MAANTPFSVTNTEGSKKGEKSVKSTTLINGKQWAVLKPNIGSKNKDYDWQGTTFNIDLHTATGLTNGDSTWLLFTTDKNALDKVFQLGSSSKPASGQGKWDNNEEETNTILDGWVKDGCLCAVLCNGIKHLELLSKHSEGNLFGYPGLTVDVTKKDFDESKVKEFVEYQVNELDQPSVDTDLFTINESQNTLITLVLDKAELKVKVAGRGYIDMPTIPVEGLDTLPKVKALFNPPEVKAAYSGSSYKGGGGEVTPKEREIAVFQHFGVNTFSELMGKIGLNGDMVAQLNVSLALAGCQFGVQQATQTITETTYLEVPVSEGNGKTIEPYVSSESNIITNVITEENVEPTEDDTIMELITIELGKTKKWVPDSVDVSNKSAEWKNLFYQCLISKINDKPIYESQQKLAVKRKMGDWLYNLDESGLQQVLDEIVDKVQL